MHPQQTRMQKPGLLRMGAGTGHSCRQRTPASTASPRRRQCSLLPTLPEAITRSSSSSSKGSTSGCRALLNSSSKGSLQQRMPIWAGVEAAMQAPASSGAMDGRLPKMVSPTMGDSQVLTACRVNACNMPVFSG